MKSTFRIVIATILIIILFCALALVFNIFATWVGLSLLIIVGLISIVIWYKIVIKYREKEKNKESFIETPDGSVLREMLPFATVFLFIQLFATVAFLLLCFRTSHPGSIFSIL